MMSIFSCASWSFVSSLEKCLFLSTAHFLYRVLAFFFILSCILDINPLSDVSLANILSFSRLSFCFVDDSFHCEKSFKFN